MDYISVAKRVDESEEGHTIICSPMETNDRDVLNEKEVGRDLERVDSVVGIRELVEAAGGGERDLRTYLLDGASSESNDDQSSLPTSYLQTRDEHT
jgi:hypothetical protein